MKLNTPMKILAFCILSFQSSWYFIFYISGTKQSLSERVGEIRTEISVDPMLPALVGTSSLHANVRREVVCQCRHPLPRKTCQAPSSPPMKGKARPPPPGSWKLSMAPRRGSPPGSTLPPHYLIVQVTPRPSRHPQ
jgi:hypothetical protein